MSNIPRVSIIMPNLNNRRFLTERLDSILNQTLRDWELIVVDSYSDDGAWELIQNYAAHDRRFRISQAARDGLYANLNRGIAQARGEYVYLATSDDTMSPDCLEKMTTALDAHPECGICHTSLTVIDEQGQEIPGFWRKLPTAQFYGALLDVPHIRLAPYDGILHCALYTVYTSLTQLLIRRTIFDTIGIFRSDWGAESDFEWGMRAGLRCNVLHLPETLAAWRIHPQQATRPQNAETPERKARLCQMMHAALKSINTPTSSLPGLPVRCLTLLYRQEQFLSGIWACSSRRQHYTFLLKFLFIRPAIVLRFLFQRFWRKPYCAVERYAFLRQELKRLGLTNHVVRLPLRA